MRPYAKVILKSMPIETRVALMKRGTEDRSESVRKLSISLLADGWLEKACEGNPVRLAGLLDSEAHEEDVVAIFSHLPSLNNGPKYIDLNDLTIDSSIVLRCIGMRSFQDSTDLEEVIPSLAVYAEALKYYYQMPFILRQLLAMAPAVDQGDEGGRRIVLETLRQSILMDSGTSTAVLTQAVKAFRVFSRNSESSEADLIEIILHWCSEEPELVSDDEVPHQERGILLCEAFLQGTKRSSSCANRLGPILELAIVPMLVSPDSFLRIKALRCLALYCVVDQTGQETIRHATLLIQACQNDVDEVRIEALRCLVDFVMVMDDALTLESSELGPIVTSLLLNELTHPLRELREVATEGLAKLIFRRRIPVDHSILRQLLLQYFSPESAEDVRSRQCLAVFFPAFGATNSEHRVLLEETFMGTMRVLTRSSKASALSGVSVLDVAHYLLDLTAPTLDHRADSSHSVPNLCHLRIALSLLHEILDIWEDDISSARTLARVLAAIRVDPEDEYHRSQHARLRTLVSQCLDTVTDKRCSSSLLKFHEQWSPSAQPSTNLVHLVDQVSQLTLTPT
uniref:Nuclear condensin complex subunit 3 C-terminal domain-containing protein n=1 Tax=Compsopogon caeruleus TaxID=31354 RepID=A0A7S1TAQ7_9RHOD|mmetsp:Transcript_14179/g.29022  ORF Transcript_14179/g.29022 Transcript_14179/m.29022 type:complete len:568 (+) Transcript_14179:711-2414(+)